MPRRKRQPGRKRRNTRARPKRRPTLSVCMIAKDEASFLKRCLASIRDLADEIVVADTGSSDETRQVAGDGGALVIDLPWSGDFSEARNASLRQASGDWVLVLDCDEVLAERDLARIRKAVGAGRATGYRMTTRNYSHEADRVGWTACTGEYDEENSYPGWFPTTKVRLFRNDAGIRFEGALHELVEGTIDAIDGRIADCPVPVHHYGYVEKDRPVAQYAEAAQLKAEDQPDDPEALYQLALARRDAGDLPGAAAAIGRCVSLMGNGEATAGQYMRPDFVHLVSGDIASRMGDREAEEAAYRRALDVNPECYQALNNLGSFKQKQGDLETALDYYSRASRLAPDVDVVQENIRRVETLLARPQPSQSDAARKPGTRPGLSLCMIAKNEAERLGTCLDSVAGLVDEIVVVDTGSTDDTVAIAERYGAKVGYFEWCDDFSAARNVSLGLATCRWIVWLDPDDILPKEEHAKIRSLVQGEPDKGYYFVLDSKGFERVSCLQMRLFPNVAGVEFEMPVHEQVTPSLARAGVRCKATDIRVIHTGYTTPEVVREKQERYVGIMENWLVSHPDDYIVRSHAAMTYYNWGHLDRAIEHYEQILDEGGCRRDRNLIIETTVELYLGRCLMRKQAFERALPHLLGARGLDDEYAVTHLTLGECYTRMGRAEEALASLAEARRFEDQVTFAATDPAALRYSIRFFTAQNLEAAGNLPEAEGLYREASDADPSKGGALGAAAVLIWHQGRKTEAVGLMEQALQREPDNQKHRFNLGTFYLEAGEDLKAADCFRQVLEANPDLTEAYLNLGIVARRGGDTASAERMYRLALEKDPGNLEGLANLGHLLVDIERYREAREAFERALTTNGQLLDVNLGLAVALAAEGRHENLMPIVSFCIRALFGDALGMSVPDGVSAAELAALFAECGRMLVSKEILVCARLAYLAAHLMAPEDPCHALVLAEIHRATGEPSKALPYYELVIQQEPGNPDPIRKLGDCYRAMGVPEAAGLAQELADAAARTGAERK